MTVSGFFCVLSTRFRRCTLAENTVRCQEKEHTM
nr:MAG TPA: hypothetical protein [Caudoviricetes sp.]